jgi:hypothetical protein
LIRQIYTHDGFFIPEEWTGAHRHSSEQHRELAENGLILRVQIGSGALGMKNAETDDRDEMGICLLPPEFVVGLGNDTLQTFEQYEYHTAWAREGGLANRSGPGDVDLTVYSAQKWMKLALDGNPTVLMPLFVHDDDVMLRNQAGNELVAYRDRIISRKAGQRFLGYLGGQKRAMLGEKKAHTNRPELVAKHGFDTKYAAHAIRLGLQGAELMRTGRITMPLDQMTLAYLKLVRAGEIALDEVMHTIARVERDLKVALYESTLPEYPDRVWANNWLFNWHKICWGGGKSCLS